MSQFHDLKQGSAEWHVFRRFHLGASEASAMLGLSPYKTRDELLYEKSTGIVKEVGEFTQSIFDKGHAGEALTRPIVEKSLGVELYPVIYSLGDLSASCDGLSLDGAIAWENKQFNRQHFEEVKNGILPNIHWPQCQQVLLVTGAKQLHFTVSDGTLENTVGMWVYPDVTQQKQLIDGWAQFERDFTVYVLVESVDKPKSQAMTALPGLSIQLKGEVVSTNLPAFKESAEAFIANIKTELITDEDFSNAEATVKFCKEAEDSLENAKNSALSQTASIDELMRTIDYIKDQLRTKRLALDKSVTSEKEKRKLEMLVKARNDYKAMIERVEATILPMRLLLPMPDFGAAMKGLKTTKSMQGAINDCLASAEILATNTSGIILKNLEFYNKEAEAYKFLFVDINTLIASESELFEFKVLGRIEKYKADITAKKALDEAYAASKAESEIEATKILAEVKEIFKAHQPVELEIINPIMLKSAVKPKTIELVQAIADLYFVNRAVALTWLLEADFQSLSVSIELSKGITQ